MKVLEHHHMCECNSHMLHTITCRWNVWMRLHGNLERKYLGITELNIRIT
jgi:hypothetical protein